MNESPLLIHVAASAEEALPFVAKGYHPVYQQRGMALDGYLTYHGWKRDDPRFFVVGEPTEETTLAIACFASIVPAPVDPAKQQTSQEREVMRTVVLLVSRITEGKAMDLLADKHPGSIILAWRHRQKLARVSGGEGALAAWWKLAVEDWAALLSLPASDREFQVAREAAS